MCMPHAPPSLDFFLHLFSSYQSGGFALVLLGASLKDLRNTSVCDFLKSRSQQQRKKGNEDDQNSTRERRKLSLLPTAASRQVCPQRRREKAWWGRKE